MRRSDPDLSQPALRTGCLRRYGSATVARFSNRVRFLRNVSLTVLGRAVAVLGDDQLGDARLVVGIVVVGPVKK